MSWLDPDKRTLKRKVGSDISLRTQDIQRELYHIPSLRSIIVKVKRHVRLKPVEKRNYLKAYRRVYARRYRQVNKDHLRTYHRIYRRHYHKQNMKTS